MATPRDHKPEEDAIKRTINAAVAVNVGRPGSTTAVSSRQRIVQRNGRTVVDETFIEHTEERERSE